MSETPNAPDVTVKPRKRQDANILDLDQSSLDPAKHYRWVRCRKDEYMQSVQKHKLRGYQLEKKGGVKTVVEPDDRPDGIIAIGDLVLMSCPKERHEERRREIHQRTETMLASTSATTEQMAKEKGIEIIKDRDHNKQRQE